MLSDLSNRRAVVLSFLMLASIVVLAACASAGHARDASSCQLRANDSTFAAGRMLYRDCAVDERAQLITTNIHPDFHPPPRPGTVCYSADLEFVVDSAGRPELRTARVAHANNSQLGDALLAILPTWKYEPARIKGRPVRQLVLDHEVVVGATVVAVPAGSPPPTRPPQPTPSC